YTSTTKSTTCLSVLSGVVRVSLAYVARCVANYTNKKSVDSKTLLSVFYIFHVPPQDTITSYYFDRDDIALHNFAKFFRSQSHEEREHAEKLMKVQNERGGRIFLQDVRKPEKDEWASGVEALEAALALERSVNQSLLDMHKVASDHTDPHMCDFIETHFLDEQVKSIKELSDWVTNLRRMGAPQNGMAEYLFDKHTLGKESS
ncbi:hypothetical protein CRUP_013454, partial [Coryphaenoides rupestris]